MWEKLKIQERDRILGFLFLVSLLGFLAFSLLALGLPQAALVGGVFILLALAIMFTRVFLIWLQIRSAHAPIGPLSLDEKLKARSKLLNTRRQTLNSTQPPAPTYAYSPTFY